MVDKIKAGGVGEARSRSNFWENALILMPHVTWSPPRAQCLGLWNLDNHDALSATQTEEGNFAEEGCSCH